MIKKHNQFSTPNSRSIIARSHAELLQAHLNIYHDVLMSRKNLGISNNFHPPAPFMAGQPKTLSCGLVEKPLLLESPCVRFNFIHY
jgi:hypothetical protein